MFRREKRISMGWSTMILYTGHLGVFTVIEVDYSQVIPQEEKVIFLLQPWL